MKRLSALIVGAFMVLGVQSAFGMEGYEEGLLPSDQGIRAALSADANSTGTECYTVDANLDGNWDHNEPRIERVCSTFASPAETEALLRSAPIIESPN